MADDQKRYSEDEHIAILADRVTRETADITAARDALATEKTDLENKLDVETSARESAEQRATDAEKALEDHKAEVAEREAALAKKDERLGKAREAAAHMGEDFFTDAKRVERIVAMSEDQFEGYLGDLGATGRTPGKTTTDTPRETAMAGDKGGDGGASIASAGRAFLNRGFVATSPAKEA